MRRRSKGAPSKYDKMESDNWNAVLEENVDLTVAYYCHYNTNSTTEPSRSMAFFPPLLSYFFYKSEKGDRKKQA